MPNTCVFSFKMGTHLLDYDISHLLLEILKKIPFYSTLAEKSDEAKKESRETDSEAEDNVLEAVVANKSSPDSEMEVPLSTFASQPSGNSTSRPLTLFFWLLITAGIIAKIIQMPDIKNNPKFHQ